MPVCPKCSAEYRAGFTRCSDCDVDLIERIAKRKADKRHSDTDLRLMFSILWTVVTSFAFWFGATYGIMASLGGGGMIFYVLAYGGALSSLFQSLFIFWAVRRSRGSQAAGAVRAASWILLTTAAWVIAVPVGFVIGGAAGGLFGVVIGACLIGGLVGLFQFPVLWRALRSRSLWWILVNAAAFLIAAGGSALWESLNNPSISVSPEVRMVQSATVLGPAFGAVTGLSLWWLLRRSGSGYSNSES